MWGTVQPMTCFTMQCDRTHIWDFKVPIPCPPISPQVQHVHSSQASCHTVCSPQFNSLIQPRCFIWWRVCRGWAWRGWAAVALDRRLTKQRHTEGIARDSPKELKKMDMSWKGRSLVHDEAEYQNTSGKVKVFKRLQMRRPLQLWLLSLTHRSSRVTSRPINFR